MELSEVIIDLVTDTETDASQKSDIEHNINGCDIKDQGLSSHQYDVSDQDIVQDSPKTDISKEHNTHLQDPPCPVEQAAQPISNEDVPALEKSLTDLRGIVEIGMTTNISGIMDKTGIAVNLTKPGDKGTCKPPKKRKNKEGKMDGCYKLKRNKTTTQDIKSKKVRVKPMENKVKKSTSFKRIRKVDSGQNVSVKVLTMHATPVEPHQKYSDIVQVNHSRTGKIHFFSGTIPVFIMADSMEHLQTSDAGDKQVYLICIEKNQIHAMMVDNIKPGVYLINFVKHMCDQKHKFSHQLSIEDNLITWTIQKAILSSYLSSLTDPMPGHHYLVIGELKNKYPVTSVLPSLSMEHALMYVSSQVDDNGNKLENESAEFTPCKHYLYNTMKSLLQNCEICWLQKGQKKFQLRISYKDHSEEKKNKKSNTGLIKCDISP